MTSNKDLGNLSGSYAINGLDDAELAAFEQHLAQSDETRNEVIELTDTAVLLGLAVEPVEPSAGLKQSILDQLDAHPQVADDGTAPMAAAPAQYPSPAQLKSQSRWFTRPVVALAAAAAAVALVTGGGMIASTFGERNFDQAQVDQLTAITSADDAQRASIPVENGGTATLVWSNQLLSSALIVDEMASLPDGKVYELWYINDAGARPAGTFSASDDGRTWRVLSGTMQAGDTVGVTVEPAGGSVKPSTDPVILIASA